MFKRMTIAAFTSVGLFAIVAGAQPSPTTKPSSGATTKPSTPAAAEGKKTTTESGLTIIEVAPGDPAAKDGDIVWVNYTGTLKDGTEFDSSKGRDPIRFMLGKGEVIKGWDEGVKGMKVGEKRQLIIPPTLGYGAQATGKIPANSELHFDVELIGIARVGEEAK
jgi:FKBP-type peptidyl-prolyl cis-trans isomerase